MRVLHFVLCAAALMITEFDLSGQKLSLEQTHFIGGTHGGCWVKSAIPTPNGDIFWCGVTYDSGTADIPRVIIPFDFKPHTVIGKTDLSGSKKWVKVLTGQYDAGAKEACVTPEGGYMLLTGSPLRNGDIRILKVDESGNPIWTKSFGSSSQEFIHNIISTADKGFLIFGASLGSDGDIPFNYKYPPVSFQPQDWVLIKTDSLGNKEWVKVLGTSGDEKYGVLITDGISYYLVASTVTKDHDCVDSVGRENYSGLSIYVIKVDVQGNVLWSKAYGGGFVASAIYDSRDSSIVITGTCEENVFEFQGNHGGSDMYLFKIDVNGKFKWAHQYGDVNIQNGQEVTIAPNMGYYLVGHTFKMTATPFPYIGGQDNWLFKTDSLGNQLTQKIFGSIKDELNSSLIPVNDRIMSIGYTSGKKFTEGTGQNYVNPDSNEVIYNSYFSIFKFDPLFVLPKEQANDMYIYPNPTNGTFNVKIPMSSAESNISCYDLTGKIVFKRRVPANIKQLTIDTKSWQAGVYTICWSDANKFNKCERLLLK